MSHHLRAAAIVLGVLLASAPAFAQPPSNSALEFDGDDFVEISDPVNVSEAFTVEAWIRADTFDGGRIVSNRVSGQGYELDVDSFGRVRLAVDGMAGGIHSIDTRQGEWIHVAATWSGGPEGTVSIYVDGELAKTDAVSQTISSSTGPLRIGSMVTGNFPFSGGIDEVRIFDTIVDAATINHWHTRVVDASHPDYADLVGAWSLETGSGQTITDSGSIGGRDGQLGSTTSSDGADPSWITSGMVPLESLSIGGLKARFE